MEGGEQLYETAPFGAGPVGPRNRFGCRAAHGGDARRLSGDGIQNRRRHQNGDKQSVGRRHVHHPRGAGRSDTADRRRNRDPEGNRVHPSVRLGGPARWGKAGLALVVVALASLFFCGAALAREYASDPTPEGGFAQNPDGTYSFYGKTGEREAVWSKADYESMARTERMEELMTEGTGQGGSSATVRSWVKGAKEPEWVEARQNVEQIEAADNELEGSTLTKWPSYPVEKIGGFIEDEAANDGILPKAAALLDDSAPFGTLAAAGGIFVAGVTIGNYIDVLAGWPTVESFIEGFDGATAAQEILHWEWRLGNVKIGKEVECKKLHEGPGGEEIPEEGRCWPVSANRTRYCQPYPALCTAPTEEEDISQWTAASPFRGGSESGPCLSEPNACEDPICPVSKLGIIVCSESNGLSEVEKRPTYRLYVNGNITPPKFGSWPKRGESCEKGTLEVVTSPCEVPKEAPIKTKLEPITPTEWNPNRASEEEGQHTHEEHKHKPEEEKHKIPGPIIEPEIPEVKPGELEQPYVNEVHTNGYPNVEAVELPLDESDPSKGPEAVTTVTPAPETRNQRETHVHVDYNNKAEPEPAEAESEASLGTVSVPPISLPKVGPLCKAFPFGVPCWLIETMKGWVAASTVPEWCLKHYEIPFLHRTIATHCQSLSFLEPVMTYLRPAMVLFATLGLVLLFFNFTRGGGLPSGSGVTQSVELDQDERDRIDDLFNKPQEGW